MLPLRFGGDDIARGRQPTTLRHVGEANVRLTCCHTCGAAAGLRGRHETSYVALTMLYAAAPAARYSCRF